MAMSKCKECGKAVSTLAKTCPNCGVPKPALKIKIKKKIAAKTKKNKPPGLSTKKTSNRQYEYNPKTGSFEKGGKIQNEVYYNPKTGSFERESKKTRILKANDKINEEEQARRQDEFRRNKQYWKEQEQIRKQDELKREEQIRREQRREEELRRKEEEQVSEQISSPSVSSSSTNKGTLETFLDGNLDLATSFWGFLIVGTFVVAFVCGWLSGAYGNGWLIPAAIYTFFAVGGTWASAENYKKKQLAKQQSVLWGILAQIVCVLNVISIIATIVDMF